MLRNRLGGIRLHRPSPAMAVALIALFVTVGGTASAAIVVIHTPAANSVGTKQLKNKAVTEAKLGNNAVTSGKVKDGSLLAKDFKAGQLPAGLQGPQGLQGPKGDTGPRGDTGPSVPPCVDTQREEPCSARPALHMQVPLARSGRLI